MGCGESRPKLAFDDFKLVPEGASEEEAKGIKAVVDKKSVKAVWEKKYPDYELTGKELDDLAPGEAITEENEEKLFPAFRDKFLKLADRKRRLDELAKDPKPYLEQYFKECTAYMGTCMELTVSNIFAIMAHGNPENYLKDQLSGWHNRTGKPLIAKSLDHHDINGDAVLDPDEAELFFKHMMECYAKFAEFHTKLMLKKSLELQCYNKPPGEKYMIERYIEQKVMPKINYMLKSIDAAAQELFKDEAKLKNNGKAAFSLMDKNGNGTLELEEVAAILNPVGDKSIPFYKALGLDVNAVTQKASDDWDKDHPEEKAAD